jgi:serine/threonine-protein kinase
VAEAGAASEAAVDPGLLVGQTIGDFEILEVIGEGGMGLVYKARQQSLDRIVALKTLHPYNVQNPVLLARFLTEARAEAGLRHPNIVNVYQVGQCAAGHYMVMEFIEGRTLEVIARERIVPISWATSLMVTVAEAVHFAHTQKIIHRDLKPANIMIDRFRRPVVMDFGLAKLMGSPASVTQHGVIMGTPSYMSPEQAGEDPTLVGPRSDVYSLGAILYRLLTGQPPFESTTSLNTVMKVIAAAPRRPRDLRPDLPHKLERVCLKCLAKQPEDRYSTALALAEDLRRFHAAHGQKGTPTSHRASKASVVLVAQETGKTIRLFAESTLIGRASDCDVVLRVADVSKHHCRILLEKRKAIVEDLGSANGTLVNGQRVERAVLQDGDQLDVGGHVFAVQRTKDGK